MSSVRKLVLGFVAVAALACVAPSTTQAHPCGYGWGGRGFGYRAYGVRPYAGFSAAPGYAYRSFAYPYAYRPYYSYRPYYGPGFSGFYGPSYRPYYGIGPGFNSFYGGSYFGGPFLGGSYYGGPYFGGRPGFYGGPGPGVGLYIY